MYEVGQEEIDHLSDIILNRKLFRYQLDGKSECQLFEEEVAKKLGVNHALLVTSGTNALVCSLAVLGIGPGDEVIIPSYTFVATAIAVTMVGAVPVIANIDEELGISIQDIRELINSRTKAIIPVHMDGIASDMDGIMKLANEFSLFVVEDTAQAFGGSFNGKRLGTIGHLGCFSFNCDKILTAGEGGLVVTNDRELFEKLFCMMDASGSFNPCNKDFFTQIKPFMGMSMRVSNIMGGMLRVQLKRLDRILENLRARKEIFRQELAKVPGVRVIEGRDIGGGCSTILHLFFNGPDTAVMAGKKLRQAEFLVYPPTMKPAHVCWKWTKMLGNELSSYHPKHNPYQLSEQKYSYSMAKYMKSMDIIMCCLKYEINYSLSLDETRALAVKMSQQLMAQE